MTETESDDTDFAALRDIDTDTDELFDVLSNQRRRFVVRCLDTYATPMPLSDVADEIATWEHDKPINEIPAEDVNSIYAMLYHAHIPKMVDAGMVEYSQDRDAVTLAAEYDDLASSLPLADGSR